MQSFKLIQILLSLISILKHSSSFTESQNHRGWKGPLEIIESNPLLTQGLYGMLHRKASRWAWNIFNLKKKKFKSKVFDLLKAKCVLLYKRKKKRKKKRWGEQNDLLQTLRKTVCVHIDFPECFSTKMCFMPCNSVLFLCCSSSRVEQ